MRATRSRSTALAPKVARESAWSICSCIESGGPASGSSSAAAPAAACGAPAASGGVTSLRASREHAAASPAAKIERIPWRNGPPARKGHALDKQSEA